MKKHKDFINKVKKTDLSKFSNKKKVELGLVDDFDYSFEELEDETSRLSYSVYEWYEEKFEAFREARMVLRDVYINGSEAFLDIEDVRGDEQILYDIETAANEIGLDKEEIYPNWQEHHNLIMDLANMSSEFENQVRELRDFGL
tara:strand:+ start:112 stop:543 length:432 start_codon:yes stop_codon:yes gene_type:complete